MTMSVERRRFLLGLAAAGVGVGLGAYPLLSRSGLWQLAQAPRNGQAKLKVVFYIVPDGLGIDSFNKQGGEWDGKGIWHPHVPEGATHPQTTQFELNEVSSLLEPYRKRSLYIRGSVVLNGDSPFGGHNAWQTSLRDAAGAHSSIDVLFANEWKGNGGFRHIHAGPHTAVSNAFFVTWDGTSMQSPQSNPLALFDQLFGQSLVAGTTGVRSAHVFDAAKADIDDLVKRVNGSEKQKLQTHLDAVEQVAADLGGIAPPLQCSPQRPQIDGVDMNGSKDRIAVHHAHNQVVATALGCGLARVATVQVAASSERTNFPDVAPTRNPHDLAHLAQTGSGDIDRRDWLEGRRWYIHRFKHFLDELDKQPDPDVEGGRLSDYTLVILTSEMSDGAQEHMMDMPLLMIGGQHTPLHTNNGQGLHLDIMDQGDITYYPGRPPKQVTMQRIWATLARSLGIAQVPYAGNVSSVNHIFSNVHDAKFG